MGIFSSTKFVWTWRSFWTERYTFCSSYCKKFDDAISTGKNEITVWGDGSQMRDFLFIEDLVDVLEQTLEMDDYDNEIINVATGCDTTVKEIVLLIKKYLDMKK